MLIKSHLLAQVLVNILAIIIFSNICYSMKKLSQKSLLDMKNVKIIRPLSLSSEGATIFPSQRFQYHPYMKHF